jgi:DNA end-binding protein Ku
MAATVCTGYITIGLISIPVRLFSGARSEHVEFHQLHSVCESRIKQQLYCPHCKRVVPRDEIVKGHEVAKDRYVLVDDKEIEKVAPASSDAMEISDVVALNEIDPIYFESSYYAVPEAAGRKAYSLLFETMRDSGLAAIAKLAMHRREYTVVIRTRENGLTLHTMYYQNEVRQIPEYEDIEPAKISQKEIDMAKRLLENMKTHFDPSKYHDEYQERLQHLVEAKKKGRTVRATPQPKLAPVVNLMEALQASLKKTASPASSHARKKTAHRALKKAS